MARIASQQIAGYYPTPKDLLSSFASTLKWPHDLLDGRLLDPCAGDGEAILALRQCWVPKAGRGRSRSWRAVPSIIACELEGERAEALHRNLDWYDVTHHGDAFCLVSEIEPTTGATVLYLNPPYDHDAEHGRLEQRFLVRFTRDLHPGAGFLFFLVPHRALLASADFLARHYLDLRAWRLPDEHFARFRQVLVVGRRAARPLSLPSFARIIEGWARRPQALPVLPERCPDPLEIPGDARYALSLRLAERDLTASLDAFRPWAGTPVGVDATARHLLGPRFVTAVPPKPAHVALALSTGLFNGRALRPNRPGLPRLLAKGTFRRRLAPVGEKTNAEGEVTGTVEIERPVLELTVLRLDDHTFHTLKPGVVPTGSDDLADWNSADLIDAYSQSLAVELHRQFPALHDPRDKSGWLRLPELARRPFEAQSHAIQAALKLLARGLNPFIVAEVGVGKTTIALYIAAALSPAHHADTTAQLARLAGPAATSKPVRLPTVRRTLVLCPPHLLKSWTDQVAAVLPGARVQVVRGEPDLQVDADVYLLSRETAKLGHAYRGLEGTCPTCGHEIPGDAPQNAARRRRCQAKIRRRPRNLAARLAEDLATLLAFALPRDPLVRSIVPSPRLRAALDRPQLAACPLSRDACRSFLDRLAQLPELDGRVDVEPTDVRGLVGILERLHGLGIWEDEQVCDTPLYQAIPEPRRYPLAKRIRSRYRRRFDLVLVDEGHEFNQTTSAQTKAAHRLMTLPGVPTVILTGSVMGGYASSLFANFWALSPRFREQFSRADKARFVDTFGYRKVFVPVKDDDHDDVRRGVHTDRELRGRNLGEAPGVLPTFILRHLLPTAVLLHKEDLALELPPLHETPVAIGFEDGNEYGSEHDLELRREYRRLEARLLAKIRAHGFSPQANRLLGALVELPSYLDRCTDDLAPFEVRDPDGDVLATGRSFPASWRTPKERWLLKELRRRLDEGERVVVFLRHTGTAELPRRILGLIRARVTSQAVWLDTKKVPTKRREEWIDRNVLGKDVKVLLVNPNAVKTGLNNLIGFSTAIWHELDYSATTYRQANGRFHRIGQTRPVSIRMPFYEGTAQQVAFDLIARKVTASLQVDGLDLQAALEAAGASDERAASVATAMSLGQAVYEALTAKAA